MKSIRACLLPLSLSAFLVWFDGGLVSRLFAGEPFVLTLRTNVLVDGEGVFLNQIVSAPALLPAIPLAPAPAFGQSLQLTRGQVQEQLRKFAPNLVTTNWLGALQCRLTRRARAFAENDLRPMLTDVLQREFVKDRGELDLRLSRPWQTINLPDEPLNLKLLDMPASGVGPMFIVRFELRTARESLGTWQASVLAKVWKEVWVAQSPIKRGELLRDADFVRQRRDMLTVHEPLAEFVRDDSTLELAEGLPAGAPLLTRSLRLRALVHRGQRADAVLRDGALEMTMKVEVLEDGVPGQIVRARNPDSRREIRGKVLNEQTLLVVL
jgi:flagella basal body P-ring formation protein FlgA